MLPQYFVYVAILTSSLAIYSYLKDVVKGKTKPNLASWFIWFLAPMVAAIVGWKNGAGISVLPVFLAGFIPFLVIVFSVFNKDSYWKLKKLDYVCLFLSFCALGFWFYFKEGTLATIFAILADGIAYIPTYIKSWKSPDSETAWPYGAGIFANLLGLATMAVFSFNTVAFAVYLIIANILEISILFFRRKYLNIQN
ncbi:MAG: hypothetical protein AAB438_01695 [Patescibacteria group bacterium]